MAELNGLKVYKMKVDKEKKLSGVDFHSFVDNPAIDVLFKTFNKNDKRFTFNSEKQIVTGPFMIPDLPIYRNDHSHGEYYVVFEKQTIQDLNEKFMSEQKTLHFNYQHLENSMVSDVVLIENWIVGENDTKAKSLGFDVPVGTWMGSVKINNKKFWDEEIKSGNVRGFSIEGFLDMEMKSQKKINMSKIKLEAQAKTKDGKTLKTSDESMMVGSEVMVVADDMTEMVAPDGDYELESGEIVTVLAGKITAIVEMDEELSAEEAALIQTAMASVIKPMQDKIAELELKLANVPGAKPATEDKEDKPTPVRMSVKLSLRAKLAGLKERNKEIEKLNN